MASDNRGKSDKNKKKRSHSHISDPPPFRSVNRLPNQRESTPFRNAPPVFLNNDSNDNPDRRSVIPDIPPYLPPPAVNRFNSPNLVPSQQFRKPPAFKQQASAGKPTLASRNIPPLSTQQVEDLATRLLTPQAKPAPGEGSNPPPVPTPFLISNPAPAPRPSQSRNATTLMPPPPARSSLPQQLHSALQTATIPLPSLPWLTTLSSSRNPPPPLASLLATARARILAADLTTPSLLDPTYASTHCFPPNLSNPQTPSCSLPADIIIQVLDVENLSKSRWEQVEELESMARGETKRGREIIRIQDQDAEGEDGGVDQVDRGQATQSSAQFTSQASSSGAAATQQRQVQGRQQHQQQQQQQAHESNKNATHKLLMQDCKGQKVYGIELKRVERIGVGPSSTLIGQKILLKRGAEVSRGVVMLEPSKTVVLGGKVEVWNKAWNEGRLERLKGAAERGGEPA